MPCCRPNLSSAARCLWIRPCAPSYALGLASARSLLLPPERSRSMTARSCAEPALRIRRRRRPLSIFSSLPRPRRSRSTCTSAKALQRSPFRSCSAFSPNKDTRSSTSSWMDATAASSHSIGACGLTRTLSQVPFRTRPSPSTKACFFFFFLIAIPGILQLYLSFLQSSRPRSKSSERTSPSSATRSATKPRSTLTLAKPSSKVTTVRILWF